MNQTAKPNPLGRGLSALFGDADTSYKAKSANVTSIVNEKSLAPRMVAIEKLQPGTYQPRNRFDEDVLSPPGVKWLIVLEGINDIGQGARANALPENAVTAAELIAADRQMIERAHLRGIKGMGATLTPYGGAAYSSEKGEAIREAVNTWIRTGGAFDAVVDFEAATRDPNNPKQFRAEFDSGDHLHPSDAGYQAMADAIDLAVFGGKPVSSASNR